MNWKETKGTIKANYSKKHLKEYGFKRRIYIILANTYITLKAFLLAIIGWAKGSYPKSKKYQNENHIFKAWFCEAWVIEMLKW
jgi:hypothetical protein